VGINERLMTPRLELDKNRSVTIIGAYAPTLDSEEKSKEAFFAELDKLLKIV